MAYQKLQLGLAAIVVPSDTIDIPLPSSSNISGDVTAIVVNKLEDSNSPDFTTIAELTAGAIVVNTTTNAIATVTAIDSAHVLSLSADIFAGAVGENYEIYLDPQANHGVGAILYVGAAGDVKVKTTSGSVVTYVGVNAGTFMPVQVIQVFATGTSATSIIANW